MVKIKKKIQKRLTEIKKDFIVLANSCKTCYGYGLWAIGNPSPMGPMDAADGCPTKKCPECGKG